MGALRKAEVYHHFPEQVKRQYGFVHDIHRDPTSVLAIPPDQDVQTFLDFCLHVIPLYQWGQVADDVWQYTPGYVVRYD